MSKSWCTDLASVRAVRPIATKLEPRGGACKDRYPRNKVNAHLALGGFDCAVGLAGWYGVTLAKQLSM